MRTWFVLILWVLFISCGWVSAAPAIAGQSENYSLSQSLSASTGDTRSANGRRLHDSAGEPVIGHSFGSAFSVQAGYFNEYFLPAPTPTVTPTVIRTFGNEILSPEFVFAAPNPIRGLSGKIFFDLASPAEVSLKIFTPSGNLVLSQHWDRLETGTRAWIWNTDNMANGVYLLWIKATSSSGKATTVTKKLALIK